MKKSYTLLMSNGLLRIGYIGFLTLLLALISRTAEAQCTNTSPYGSVTLTTTANSSGTVYCNYASEYGTWSGVTAGYGYTTTSTVTGDYITVRSGSSSGPVVASGVAPLTWFAQTTATHYIHVNTNSSCGTQSSCRNITTTVLGTGCDNTNVYGSYGSGTLTTTTGSNATVYCQYAGEYSTWYGVAAGYGYTTTSTVSTDFITVRFGTSSGPIVAFGTTPLTWSANTTGTYYIHTTTSQSCGSAASCRDINTTTNGPTSGCSNPVTAGTLNAPSGACTGTNISISITGNSIGSGITYQWMNSTNGTTFANITGATSSTFSGAQTTGTYYVCQVTCSGGTPAYTDTVFVQQNSFYLCYCASAAGTQYDTKLEEFEFVNVNTASPSNSTCEQYTNYTSNVATVFQGGTYPMRTKNGSCSGYHYTAYMRAWIDFDHNGTFDASEAVFTAGPTSSLYTNWIQNVTIPSTSMTGLTGMRVIISEGSIPSPCAYYSYGETEDYLIDIQAPPANDAGIYAINSPSFPACTIDSTICVTLQNFGTDTLSSATISYSVNGGTYVTYNWTGTVLPQSVDTVCVPVGTVSFQVGDDLTVVANNPNGDSSAIYTANDTMSITNMNVSLQGTYSIPGNYATINAAIDAMNTLGVCDHVIFNLASGTYNEHMPLGEIMGAGPDATITFQSATGDTADVLVQFNGNFDTTAVVYLNGADWFRFKNITFKNTSTSYGHVFRFESGADHNMIDSNRIITQPSTSTSTNNAAIYSSAGTDNYNTISYNTIENGSFGMYMRGSSNIGAGLEMNLDVHNNDIMNPYYMGAYFYYHQGLNFSENEVSSATTYSTGYGIYFGYCKNGLTIDYNHVHPESNTGNWPYYGMYTIYCEGSAQGFEYVRNNIINAGVGAYVGFYQYYSDLMYVANNTFTVLGGTSTTSRAYYAYYSDFYFTNNNLCTNFGAGQAAGYYYGTPFSVDNNNYYALGANAFYYNGQYLTDLPAFQNAANLDPMSLSLNPNFADTLAGILCNEALDGTGVPLAYVTDDFEHITRNASTPDIGAREFVSLANFTLSGDTICGDMYEVFGPVNNATWSVDGNQSTGISVTLNTSNTPQTFNVGISFSSICNVDTATGLPIPVTASGSFRLVPAAELASSLHLCADDQATLNPGGGANATYVWFPTNETSATININAGGVYSVTKMEEGCESSATTVVTQSDGVTLLDAEACAVDLPYNVDATIVGGVSYAWSSGETTSGVALNTTGVYTVTTTDVQGCSSTDSMMFEAIDVPVANITETHTSTIYFFSSAASQNVGSNATYAWDFGDGSSPSTDANPQHNFPWTNPSAPTTFTVTLTIINDCGQDVKQMQVTPDVLGVNELEGGVTYTVYPNPSNGLVNIQFNGANADQASLRVYDMTGRVVMESSANTNEIKSLDLNSVAAGTYVLEVNLNGSSSMTRISIQ